MATNRHQYLVSLAYSRNEKHFKECDLTTLELERLRHQI